jgi:hypothetical protein
MIEKINLFNFEPKVSQFSYKFIGALSNTSFENLKEAKEYLNKNGIEIKKPSQMKICTFPVNILEKRINYAKKNEMMEKVIYNPLLLIDGNNFIKNGKSKTLNSLIDTLKKIMIELNLDIDTNFPILNDRLERLYDNDFLDNHTEYELFKNIIIDKRNYPENVIEEVTNCIKKVLGDK